MTTPCRPFVLCEDHYKLDDLTAISGSQFSEHVSRLPNIYVGHLYVRHKHVRHELCDAIKKHGGGEGDGDGDDHDARALYI